MYIVYAYTDIYYIHFKRSPLLCISITKAIYSIIIIPISTIYTIMNEMLKPIDKIQLILFFQ